MMEWAQRVIGERLSRPGGEVCCRFPAGVLGPEVAEVAMVGDGGGGMSGGATPALAKRVQKDFAIRTAARRSDACSSKLQYVFSYCAFQKSDCCFNSGSSLAARPSNSFLSRSTSSRELLHSDSALLSFR